MLRRNGQWQKNMRAFIEILTLAILATVVSSCAIVRGLKADGKNGPNIFSFEQHEHDTIACGEQTF